MTDNCLLYFGPASLALPTETRNARIENVGKSQSCMVWCQQGDRSQATVVAHEVTHSWMGNLVSCTTWEHFWLNEGWTRFVETKIMERHEGKAIAHMKVPMKPCTTDIYLHHECAHVG